MLEFVEGSIHASSMKTKHGKFIKHATTGNLKHIALRHSERIETIPIIALSQIWANEQCRAFSVWTMRISARSRKMFGSKPSAARRICLQSHLVECSQIVWINNFMQYALKYNN